MKEYVLPGLRFDHALHRSLEKEFNCSIILKEYSYKGMHRVRLHVFLPDEDALVLKLKYGKEIDMVTALDFHRQLSARYHLFYYSDRL